MFSLIKNALYMGYCKETVFKQFKELISHNCMQPSDEHDHIMSSLTLFKKIIGLLTMS